MKEFGVFQGIQNHMANEAKQMPPRKSNTKTEWSAFIQGIFTGAAITIMVLILTGGLK